MRARRHVCCSADAAVLTAPPGLSGLQHGGPLLAVITCFAAGTCVKSFCHRKGTCSVVVHAAGFVDAVAATCRLVSSTVHQQQQQQAKKQKQAGPLTLSSELLLSCGLVTVMHRLLLPWPGGFLEMPGAATRGISMLRMLRDVLQLQAPAASKADVRQCVTWIQGVGMPDTLASIAAKAYAAKCGVLWLCAHMKTFRPDSDGGQHKVGSDSGELQLVVLQVKLLLAGSAWHLRSLMRESRGLSELLVPSENDTRGRRVLDKQQLQRVPVEPAHEHALQQLGVVLPADSGVPPDAEAVRQMRSDASSWLVAAAYLVDALTNPEPATGSADPSPAAAFLAGSYLQDNSAATHADVETVSLKLPPLMLQCVLLQPETHVGVATILAAVVDRPLAVQIRVFLDLLGWARHMVVDAARAAYLARRQQPRCRCCGRSCVTSCQPSAQPSADSLPSSCSHRLPQCLKSAWRAWSACCCRSSPHQVR